MSLPRPRSMARDFQSTPVRVVIVDDHRLFVDALALLLGHDDRLTVIGTAGDGRTAIDLAVSEQAEVAVIDVRMPEIDGLETARRLRKRSPSHDVSTGSVQRGAYTARSSGVSTPPRSSERPRSAAPIVPV